MSRKAVVERVNEVLAPLGFRRRNVTWNRKVGRFVDAIDLQVSKSGDAFTLNAGVAEPELYEACWERPLREFVQVPDSMVVVRPGDLWHDGDAWWGLDDPSASDEVAAKVAKHVVPFLDRMHSFDALEKWLRDENVVRKRYPPPIIYLALLSAARGDTADACRLLDRLIAETPSESWRVRVAAIRSQLACGSLPSGV
jgi:hypothetical protein